MQDILIVVDMQNDFISGTLGSKEAQSIVPLVKKKIQSFDGTVLFTRDTQGSDYLETEEGKNLPIIHCIKNSEGWKIEKELDVLRKTRAIDKDSFGSRKLGNVLLKLNKEDTIRNITLIGLCTDICVISNAVIAKTSLPNAHIIVDSALCRGVTQTSHSIALKAMESLQIEII